GNMGMTVAEKIFARVTGRESVQPGDYLEVQASSLRSGVTVLSPNSMRNIANALFPAMPSWGMPLFDPTKAMIVDGHLGASASHRAAEGRAFARQWGEQMGVPKENFFRLGRAGVENMIAAEQCWALPGDCFFHAANGHICTAGALGAFTTSLAHESAAYLVWG